MVGETPVRGFRAGLVLDGRYRLLQPIGSGGMGTVFRAVQLGLEREVAVKLIGRGDAATLDQVSRFEREARVLAKLSHPSIVAVYDFGRSPDGTWFLVLELVRGRSLGDELDSRGPMEWHRAVEVGAQVAEALAYAHGNGVMHRDLKPQNVMIAGEEELTVKVIDFGLARLADVAAGGRLTQSALIVGTPGYIAPEYASTGAATPAVDHFALGILLHEMLTGLHPFGAGHVDTRAVREGLTTRVPGAPLPLVDLVADLLRTNPSQRQPQPVSILASLRREPTLARPLTPPVEASTKPERPKVPSSTRVMLPVPGGLVRLSMEGGRVVEVRVPAFEMDKHPVTNSDYLAYLAVTGVPAPTGWGGRKPKRSSLAFPVVGVTFEEAFAYAAWAGRRLPTEPEWELAARGPQANRYPWGNTWEVGMCHPVHDVPFDRREPGPIGVFSPQGDSPFGLSDLLTIWEWVEAPYSTSGHLVRGGPWRNLLAPAELANRSWDDTCSRDVGFRCARSVK